MTKHAKMIRESTGNLLDSPAEALVNTVNCVGVMGKGIALQFAKAFPENLKAYQAACQKKEVQPGQMFITRTPDLTGPKWIINFPTKRHWKGSSRLADVASGLTALVEEVRRLGIHSISLPPLGCGNGGLDWDEVRPLIEAAFRPLEDVEVLLFSPEGAPAAAAMPNRTRRPNLTETLAAIVGSLARYARFEYRLSLLEVQKLVYFLKIAGQPMPRTEFTRGTYGPYADSLRHVLNRMEGHFISGWGDGSQNQPDTPIYLLPDSVGECEAALARMPNTLRRFDRVEALIEGFESPLGLELLATVHWAAQETNWRGFEAMWESVHSWSPRKASLFSESLLRMGWDQLHQRGWAHAP